MMALTEVLTVEQQGVGNDGAVIRVGSSASWSEAVGVAYGTICKLYCKERNKNLHVFPHTPTAWRALRDRVATFSGQNTSASFTLLSAPIKVSETMT